jgi:hypothetical protein
VSLNINEVKFVKELGLKSADLFEVFNVNCEAAKSMKNHFIKKSARI